MHEGPAASPVGCLQWYSRCLRSRCFAGKSFPFARSHIKKANLGRSEGSEGGRRQRRTGGSSGLWGEEMALSVPGCHRAQPLHGCPEPLLSPRSPQARLGSTTICCQSKAFQQTEAVTVRNAALLSSILSRTGSQDV